MHITTHGKYLTQLTRFPLLFPVNCYLMQEEDSLTLIDTGISGCAQAILAAAQALGKPIQRIVLTHAHMDHVGSLDRLHSLLPDAEVLASARDSRLLAGDRQLGADEPQAALRGSYQRTQTHPTRLLGHGDQVGSLQVVSTPGHTPGHIALFDPRDGTLVAGDALQTRGGIAVAGTRQWRFPFPAFATWHRPTALASARQLRALAPTRLAVGHGEVLENPLAAMDQAIALAAQQIDAEGAHDA